MLDKLTPKDVTTVIELLETLAPLLRQIGDHRSSTPRSVLLTERMYRYAESADRIRHKLEKGKRP